jgi:hypothetical protein
MYQLPYIDLLFEKLVGAQAFSKIDLHSGYHQIKIHAEDIPKTTFSTRYNLCGYLVMSFGLTNTPAHFIYLMNYVFMLELDKSIVVFIDDILVHSKSMEEHEEHLHIMLQQLQRAPSVCQVQQVSHPYYHCSSYNILQYLYSVIHSISWFKLQIQIQMLSFNII